MFLKALTTGLLAIGLVILLVVPVFLGPKPADTEPDRVKAVYLVRFSAYIAVTTTCFLGAAIGSVMLVRRARERYRNESRQNFEDLIEGALHAHRPKPTQNDPNG